MDRGLRTLGIAVAVIAFVMVLVVGRSAGPTPLPADAPPTSFSAARAAVIQRAIAFQPRPAGSVANANARAVLRQALADAGFEVEEQRAFACGRHGACANVVNVVATRAGTVPELQLVMLAAHHDSVPSSPGGSDDGMGAAAVVEAARALGAGARTKRGVVVLLTDAEEDGLVGAEAFAKHHPLVRRVGAVVNVDARGSTGPSSMFETSADNRWLVDLYARAVARPSSSSLFYEVYRRMPNDTDFTVFRRTARGLSLANIENIARYHTPLDTFEGADPSTLQHHGEQAVALARALADADVDLAAPPAGDAGWFDVLGLGVVAWPLPWTQPIALLAFALVAVQAYRRRALQLDRALLAAPIVLVFALAAPLVFGLVFGWRGKLATPWIGHPAPLLASLHFASICGGGLGASLFGARSVPAPRVAWASVWLGWAFLGVASASVAPGAAWLFVVPALVAAAVPKRFSVVVPAAVAALLWLPLVPPLYEALGFFVPPLLALPTAMILTTLAPVPAPRGALVVPLGAAIVLAIFGLARPTFTADHPQRLNVLTYQAADEPTSRVVAQAAWGPRPWGDVPAPLREALGEARVEPIPPFMVPSPVARTARLDLPAPTITDLTAPDDRAARRFSFLLRSSRGASTLLLETKGAAVTVGGERPLVRGAFLAFRAVPPEGIVVVVDQPSEITLYDVTQGAAGELASRVVEARTQLATAAPSQDGDVTVLSTRTRL